MIPKANGKLRKPGIPAIADRVVQASLKLVLEPIFESDFRSCSYGFRPDRRAQDAISEIRLFASRPSNCKAGVLTELGEHRETLTGTPQGGLCSAEHKPPYAQCLVMRSAGP
jgi:retron-type reverse transcriptase